MIQDPRLMIVGARQGSLGDLVRIHAEESGYFSDVITAGITSEDHRCDVRNFDQIGHVLDAVRPHHVFCTVGVNEPAGLTSEGFAGLMQSSYLVNVVGPLEMLRQFAEQRTSPGELRKFAVVSSNSAHIARTGSLPYCASKAALTMGLRVACRELSRADGPVLAWGYEPGLLAETPMTEETRKRFPWVPLHRMPGVPPEGLDAEVLAQRVVLDLVNATSFYHGAFFRFDAGEQ